MTKEELKNKKIGFISLGCDKNRVDLEHMISQFRDFGMQIVGDPTEADIILINTCSFIADSKVESIDTIAEMCQYKGNHCEKLVVAGCLSQAHKDELEKEFPEVDRFVVLNENTDILKIVGELYGVKVTPSKKKEARALTTPSHVAYLKIADGCDKFCSYCRIPRIRGRYVSEKMEALVEEATILAKRGVKELVLVAQDVTQYGVDLYGEVKLVELINKLSEIQGIEWIRLLYCYPELITDELIDTIANNKKVCKYLDIPMQHISDDILKRMNRRCTHVQVYELIEKLRKRIPDITIRSTFIVGFPGETHKQFKQLCKFIKDVELDNVGFFKYSNEEGTPAATMKKQVPEFIKKLRYRKIYKIQEKVMLNKHIRLLDSTDSAIIDGVDGEYVVARSQRMALNVDPVIYIPVSNKTVVGEICKIKYVDVTKYDFIGEIL